MKNSLPIIACALVLGACTSSNVKNTLGLERAPPDEYRVVSRPPLSVPPQFNLRPPGITDGADGQVPASQQAQSLLTGNAPADTNAMPEPATKISAGSKAASSFLKNAGADKADPNIRRTLVEEKMARQEQVDDSSWWDVFSTNPPKKESIVNAKGESDRIKADQDAGKSVTAGDTVEVKGHDTGVLGRIFGY